MNVLLNGPTYLNEQDQTEVFQNVRDIVEKGYELTLFLKSSFEVEVMRFLLTYMRDYDKDVFSRLHLYTLYPQEQLPQKHQTLVSFAVQNGASWKPLYYKRDDAKPNVVDRKTLTSYWRQIVSSTQRVIVFLDDQEFHQLIPFDEAKVLGINAAKCYLHRPGKIQYEGDLKSRTIIFRSTS